MIKVLPNKGLDKKSSKLYGNVQDKIQGKQVVWEGG